MLHRRILHYYVQLLEHYALDACDVTLAELAELFSCTPRHVRALLKQMQRQGWVSWQASIGRGHRSILQCLISQKELQQQQLRQLVEQGKLAEALQLAGEAPQQLHQRLVEKLGFSTQHGQQILRVPYYRQMPNLDPSQWLRRSEHHLLRQIFNGLTRFKEETPYVGADLAHHWHQRDALTWQFYLRPSVYFHNGQRLQAEDIVASLIRARSHALLSNIQQVQCAAGQVTIKLSEPLPNLPLLLALPSALITPANQAEIANFASHPIGTGPYQVIKNDAWHLKFQAFEHYFGWRGLLDEIEIIHLPDASTSSDHTQQPPLMHGPSAWLSSRCSDDAQFQSRSITPEQPSSVSTQEMFLEQGGYFLLCDSVSPLWREPSQRCWLQQLLNPYQLATHLSPNFRHLWVPTTSLLPSWHHRLMTSPSCSPFTDMDTSSWGSITLGFYADHPEFKMLAHIMRQCLATQQIHLKIIELPYSQWVNAQAQVDIWLGTVNFPAPEAWHVGTWLLATPLLRQMISGGDMQQLEIWQQHWQNGQYSSEQLLAKIVQSGWLQPLFHHWMKLSGPKQAHGFHLNNLGWFDFQSTWFEPPSLA
ncbi:HTH-type transcriptional regulator SgrR [Celerinatantimonas yamalensis]|uniref:HTH-type transcriptional regulator SgrR n=1 Tax=Celerinatantimonas yamalensis TaxID=559956 RepID=A0ABW9G6E1_9GAMM